MGGRTSVPGGGASDGGSGGVLLGELSLSSRDKWPSAVRKVVEAAERAAVAAEASRRHVDDGSVGGIRGAVGREGGGAAGGDRSADLLVDLERAEANVAASERKAAELERRLAEVESRFEEERGRSVASEDEAKAKMESARAAWERQQVGVECGCEGMG